MERRWQRGETVMVRYAGGRFAEADPRHRGTVFGSPHVVVKDSDDAIALYQPEGTTLLIWDVAEQRVRERLVTRMEFLRLLLPGKRYAVALVFDTGSGVPPWYVPYFGGEGRFRGWKVDLQTPFRREVWGFGSSDEVLDIIVSPDRRWRWKDEEQMTWLVSMGLYTAADEERIREGGREAIALIEEAAPPFDDRWTDWRATSDLIVRDVPDGWQWLSTTF